MGSSTRAQLRNGNRKNIENLLREAMECLTSAISLLYDEMASEDQTDNAADDGDLVEILMLTRSLINEEIP